MRIHGNGATIIQIRTRALISFPSGLVHSAAHASVHKCRPIKIRVAFYTRRLIVRGEATQRFLCAPSGRHRVGFDYLKLPKTLRAGQDEIPENLRLPAIHTDERSSRYVCADPFDTLPAHLNICGRIILLYVCHESLKRYATPSRELGGGTRRYCRAGGRHGAHVSVTVCVVLMIRQQDLPLDTHCGGHGTCLTLRHLRAAAPPCAYAYAC